MERVISVIGLGYVGLPLATEFADVYKTVGFDVNEARIAELRDGKDRTNEVDESKLHHPQLSFTSSLDDLRKANFHVVAVPTPVDQNKNPDLTPLVGASSTVGKVVKPGDYVVFESTVYPGTTEDVCIPILENESGLKAGKDFEVGYSPERINPGDKEHTLRTIVKVVSALSKEGLEEVAKVYSAVVDAGVHKAASIKVAESAKVIENIQRDLNIALVNELSIIFNKMDIDTLDVLEAAGTKWNFLPFRPGLVGGHCIGVDPYYLTYKAQQLGYHPDVILAGRRINDSMGSFIAQQTIKGLIQAGHTVSGATVTLLGLTFKENCPDIRNTRVVDIISELRQYDVEVQVADPLADPAEALEEYGVTLVPMHSLKPAQGLILAVAHEAFRKLSAEELRSYLTESPVVVDVKCVYPREELAKIGAVTWRL